MHAARHDRCQQRRTFRQSARVQGCVGIHLARQRRAVHGHGAGEDHHGRLRAAARLEPRELFQQPRGRVQVDGGAEHRVAWPRRRECSRGGTPRRAPGPPCRRQRPRRRCCRRVAWRAAAGLLRRGCAERHVGQPQLAHRRAERVGVRRQPLGERRADEFRLTHWKTLRDFSMVITAGDTPTTLTKLAWSIR